MNNRSALAQARRIRRATLLCLPAVVFVLTVFGASKAHAAAATRPDVLILIFAGSGGQDKIGLTYAVQTPKAQVNRDLKALQQHAGWNAVHADITDAPAPMKGAKELMTSVVLPVQTVIQPETHAFALEPVIVALRNYQHVAITYFVGPDYTFQGLRKYSDKYVDISLTQGGAAYTYHIYVHDPRFDKLNLPMYQPTVGQARAAGTETRSRHVRPWQIVLVTLIAVVAGGLVYFVTSRNA